MYFLFTDYRFPKSKNKDSGEAHMNNATSRNTDRALKILNKFKIISVAYPKSEQNESKPVPYYQTLFWALAVSIYLSRNLDNLWHIRKLILLNDFYSLPLCMSKKPAKTSI